MQKFQHISTATQQAVDYIKKRQSGKEKSLKVSH